MSKAQLKQANGKLQAEVYRKEQEITSLKACLAESEGRELALNHEIRDAWKKNAKTEALLSLNGKQVELLTAKDVLIAQQRKELKTDSERMDSLWKLLDELHKVACGETQIECDGDYNDSDGMKYIFDAIAEQVDIDNKLIKPRCEICGDILPCPPGGGRCESGYLCKKCYIPPKKKT